jgi:hypothetical protein
VSRHEIKKIKPKTAIQNTNNYEHHIPYQTLVIKYGGATKTITVTVTDLDDEAPTDIQINDAAFIDDKVVFTNDKGANFFQ